MTYISDKKKTVGFHEKALKEFTEIDNRLVKIKFQNLINLLEKQGYLLEPEGKKLSNDLFEIRVRADGGSWRGIYFYYKESIIVILCFLIKNLKKLL